ncbi:MAG: DUF1593 domain-containing protein [Rikenellaceae bacterium]
MRHYCLKTLVVFILTLMLTPTLSAQVRQEKSSKKIESQKYEVIDIVLNAKLKTDTPFEVELTADFVKPSGETQSIPAFYNGDGNWVIRFSADEPGVWNYTTTSDEKALSAKKGTVTVSPEPYKNHKGAVGINKENPQKFSHHNGDDYFMMGFECDFLYALNYHNETDTPELDAMLDEVQRNRFNYMVMNVYGYDIKWEQEERLKEIPQYMFGGKEDMFPFLGSNSEPDYSALNVEFFKKLDRVITKLGDRDIVAHLMIYVWSKKVAWPELDSPEGNRYFDYVVKRYQAFPNLVWDISKEAMGYNRVGMDFITERIERVRKLDSYKRLLTVHDFRYCNAHPENVDIIVKQDWDLQYYPNMLRLHEKYTDKPSVNIEHGGYEMADYVIYGNGNYYDAGACLRRNYEAIFAGAYATHYWEGVSWNIIIYDWFKEGVSKYTPKLEYYKYMSEFFEKYPYSKLTPAPKFNSSGYCLTDGEGLYVYYLPKDSRKAEVWKLRDVSRGSLTYCWFNTHTGEFTPEVTVESFADFSMPASPWFLESEAIFVVKTTPKKSEAEVKPRVVITTDINIDKGDPDDRQSMAHLFLYADELDIRAIIIDRPNAEGVEATELVIDAYRKDYFTEAYNFIQMKYPHPDSLSKLIYTHQEAAEKGIIGKIADEGEDPLYIAVWGHVAAVRTALEARPELVNKLRIMTIGTEFKSPFDSEECGVRNWNDTDGHREALFNDERFASIWWLENNWGYNGMFEGTRPTEFMITLQNYGALGQHITDACWSRDWAHYFRVGDTPTIMYLVDNNNLDNPLEYNLGGYFVKPYPEAHPNYYIDAAPNSTWNYSDPCSSWSEAKAEVEARSAQMTLRRDVMYDDMLKKLQRLYLK